MRRRTIGSGGEGQEPGHDYHRQQDDEEHEAGGHESNGRHRSGRPATIAVFLQQPHVHHVLFVEEVERVTRHRHRAEEEIDGDVEHHTRDGPRRHAMPQGPDDDPRREHAADDVADSRDQSEERVQADADGRARNAEGFVHEVSELPQRHQVLRQLLVRLDDLGDVHFLGRHAEHYAN